MRPLILLSLLVSLACGGKSVTAPAAVINVRVVDDAGAPVNRTPVRVMMLPATRIDAATRGDGSVDVGVSDAGVYQVWIVPRDGYISGPEPLTKTVTLKANETTVVEFTVQRSGVSTAEPPGWIDGR